MSISNPVAVDISKNTLEVKSRFFACVVPNDEKGIKKLLDKIKPLQCPLIVCEATGGYERLLIKTMHIKKIAVCRANPGRVRSFARSEGVLAKTDKLDADIILRFAEEKSLRTLLPPDPTREKIRNLLDRRSQIVSMVSEEKNRLQNSDQQLHASIKRVLKYFKEEVKQIENQLDEIITSNKKLNAQVECFTNIKGVGKVCAQHVLAYLGEIEMLNRNQISALAGLAPYNRDSGVFRGKRKIIGGRGKVRTTLYMATQSAAVYNPVIREYVGKLRERGKPYKVAIVAGMRKLLIHMQSELKKLNLEVEM
jgi:transposase